MGRLIRWAALIAASPVLLQLGCFNPSDFKAIAEGQFIAFINALTNSVTSDAIQNVLGS